MFKNLLVRFMVVLVAAGCNQNSHTNPSGEQHNHLPEDKKFQNSPVVISMHFLLGTNNYADTVAAEIKLKPNSMVIQPTEYEGWDQFTADLYEDTIVQTDTLNIKINGQIKGGYVRENAPYGPESGYYISSAHMIDKQQIRSEFEGSVVVLNEGFIESTTISGIAEESSFMTNSSFSHDKIPLKGPLVFGIGKDESKVKLFFKSITPKNDQIFKSNNLFFKIAGGSSVSFLNGCLNDIVDLASVLDEEQIANRRLLPIAPGKYNFTECVPSTEVNFSKPLLIGDNVPLSKIKYFDKAGIKNVGIMSPNVNIISIDEYDFKVSSPEIKFSSIKEYRVDFPIKEFKISRQIVNFHHNWTDTTPGSTTPRPIDIPIVIDGLVSQYGWQPSISIIVEYNPIMRWEGRWTNGTNLAVGIPWKSLPNSKVAKSYKYCLVAFNYGSGLGGRRDPNIEGFGISPYTSRDAANKYCANDMKTMNDIYQTAIQNINK